MATATGSFYTSDGQIIAPDGSVFVAAGINIMESEEPTVAQIKADFPGINFVRLAIYDYASPSALSAYVTSLTNAGIVVELENHYNGAGNAGGGQGTIFTGSALATEQAWYSSVAAAFKSNPYVWFGTNNEPSETDSSGNNDPAALSAWQQTTYNTIRATGNTNPVMLETTVWNTSQVNVGYTASDYSAMSNVIWDQHWYGWITGYNTTQTTNTSALESVIAQDQQITGANGIIPVLIGEYGNSTSGTTIDPNGSQTVTAVEQVVQAGYASGGAAWVWDSGNPGDGLITEWGGTTLSSYGQQVAAAIAAESVPTTTNPVTPPATFTPSANDTVVMAGSASTLTDASGNAWTLVNGVVQENGSAAGYSANVAEIAYVNGAIWQQNTAGLWWQWSGTDWGSGNGTATSPLPATSPVTPPVVTPTASANDTTVLAGSAVSITDADGNSWTISDGTVLQNGSAAGYSANVTELAYVDGTVWQENTSGLWWAWNGQNWGAGAGTATSPLPAVTPPADSSSITVTAGGVTTSVDGKQTVSTIVDGSLFSLTQPGVASIAIGATSVGLAFSNMTNVVITGGSGTATIICGPESDTILVGVGAMSVTGGTGADHYFVTYGSGALTINDFSAARGDTLTVSAALQGKLQSASDGAGGTLLTFGNDAGAIDLEHLTTIPTIKYS